MAFSFVSQSQQGADLCARKGRERRIGEVVATGEPIPPLFAEPFRAFHLPAPPEVAPLGAITIEGAVEEMRLSWLGSPTIDFVPPGAAAGRRCIVAVEAPLPVRVPQAKAPLASATHTFSHVIPPFSLREK